VRAQRGAWRNGPSGTALGAYPLKLDPPMAKLMLSVIGAIHEFDRALIKERQREGIVLAKKRGAFKGRKKS
jgi:DNA invertase Pin-like site-specific DNA recombinase